MRRLLLFISAPWAIAGVVALLPLLINEINRPYSFEFVPQWSGGSLVCKVDQLDYFIRSLIIGAPISVSCIVALAMWAYYLPRREIRDSWKSPRGAVPSLNAINFDKLEDQMRNIVEVEYGAARTEPKGY